MEKRRFIELKDRIKQLILQDVTYKVAVFVLLLAFTALLITNTINNFLISQKATNSVLEGRAISIAINLLFTIEKLGLQQEILPDYIDKDIKGDIAFISVFNSDGLIVMHSNPQLVGKVTDEYQREVFDTLIPRKNRIKLATGEKVFSLDFPIKLRDPTGESYQRYCIRVALHPSFSVILVKQAVIGLVFNTISIMILWTLATMLYLIHKKREKLKEMLLDKQRLVTLGEMASVLAHEIRNPLSSIKGFTQYHYEKTSDIELKEDLNIILNEVSRLERLSYSLLDFTKPIKIHKKSIEIKPFLNMIIKEILSGIYNINIHVETNGLNQIYSDSEKLSQILINLLQNAIHELKDNGGDIWITLRDSEGNLVLEVRDNGPGFPERVLGRLFHPFVTTKSRGSGLGLAIVKRLVEELDGEIKAYNHPQGGAVVEITLKNAIHDEID